MDTTAKITENGRRRIVTKRQVMVKQAVNKAMAGDLRAFRIVSDLDSRSERCDTTGDSVEGPMQFAGNYVIDPEEARLLQEAWPTIQRSRKKPDSDPGGEDEC